MSALGHKRTSRETSVMSALPPKAGIGCCLSDVRFVPKADICGAAKDVATRSPHRGRTRDPDYTRPISAKILSSFFSTSGEAGTNGLRCSFALRTPSRLSMYLTGIGVLSSATPRNRG
jgi:hypothetical protein